MQSSSSDSSLRRTGVVCSKTGEKLGTIEEEQQHWRTALAKDYSPRTTPRKSATFHNVDELSTGFGSDSNAQPIKNFGSSGAAHRKRSLFFEMGERIRLFSTTSFVSPVPPSQLPKTNSLNSFECNVPTSRGSITKSRSPHVASRASVSTADHDFVLDVHDLTKSGSQLGVLCQHCTTSEMPCPKAHQELSCSIPSLYSLAASDVSSTGPLCRICHCCWPSEDACDPLISPCRCSGSLQFVHVSCLMHWLDISSRKLHRAAICELCLYKYQRRRVLKYRSVKMPTCEGHDFYYYTLFIVAILLMIASAITTVLCFHMEKSQTPPLPTPMPVTPSLLADTTRQHELGRLLSTITLAAAIVFFVSFFLAMYAHVKTAVSLCTYVGLCWSSNLDWTIEEYKHSKDTQYFNKLEELRKKLNEKQRKSCEEVEPLRSTVVQLE